MNLHSRKFLSSFMTMSLCIFLLPACSLSINSKTDIRKEISMSDQAPLSSRLQRLFEHTKLVCFGRYAMEVPIEAEVLYGAAWFPSEVKIFQGGITAMKKWISDDIAEIRKKDKSNEILFSEKGPFPNSWQTRWYEDISAKEVGRLSVRTYVNKGDLTFTYSFKASTGEGRARRNLDAVLAQHTTLADSIRVREEEEIPTTPGFCINHGFIADDLYADQEMVEAGIYLPSFPDVSFSVSSNKDAYADYNEADFKESRQGLLADVNIARVEDGSNYPKMTVLREGKHPVQQWPGEEFLFRRPDGVHDFTWEVVGKPRDVARPSELEAKLYTKVAHNSVGAAEKSALSDEEALALWDKLLGSLKFRVPVPGAPAGSVYLDVDSGK